MSLHYSVWAIVLLIETYGIYKWGDATAREPGRGELYKLCSVVQTAVHVYTELCALPYTAIR